MQVDILDLGNELRKGIQRLLPFAPIIAIDPIGAERFHEIEIGAIGPAAFQAFAARHLVPFKVANARADRIEPCLWNVDLEGCHGLNFRWGGTVMLVHRAQNRKGAHCPLPSRSNVMIYFASCTSKDETQPLLPS